MRAFLAAALFSSLSPRADAATLGENAYPWGSPMERYELLSRPTLLRVPEPTAWLEKLVVAEMRRILSDIPELSAEFLELSRVPVRFDNIYPIARTMASEILLNRKVFRDEYFDLAYQGVPLDDLPVILAARLLPVVAHEAHHAIQWRQRANMNSVEDEIDSFVTTVETIERLKASPYADAVSRQTKFWNQLTAIWSAWEDGAWNGLAAYVDQKYILNRPVKYYESPEGAHEFHERLQAASRDLTQTAERIERLKGIEDLVVDFDAFLKRRTQGLVKDRAQAETYLRRNEQVRKLISDENAPRTYANYFQRRRSRADDLWRRHFPERALPQAGTK